MITRWGEYELDDDPRRIDRDAAWTFLSSDAYWHRWRERQDVEAQIDAAWRVLGVYRRAGEMVGFAPADQTFLERPIRGQAGTRI